MRTEKLQSLKLFDWLINCQKADTLLLTPFGATSKNNIHYVDSRHYYVVKSDSSVKIKNILNNATSIEIKTKTTEFSLDHYSDKLSSKTYYKENNSSFPINDWITYAIGVPNVQLWDTIITVKSSWVVPSPPTKWDKQLIYIFLGLEGGTSVGQIIQPVLQWGVSPAGGGNYWSICNWYVTSDYHFFYDSLIKVASGTQLDGFIKLTSTSESFCNYIVGFEGYKSTLKVNNLPRLETVCVALEGYNINSCDEFPIDERIRFKKINVLTSTQNEMMVWAMNNSISICGQFTIEIDNGSKDGEIDIFLNRPSILAGTKDFFIYPNPARDFIHISPKKTYYNCRIDIYNSVGTLMERKFYDVLDFEIDVDLIHYMSGKYILHFEYNSINDLNRKSDSFNFVIQ